MRKELASAVRAEFAVAIKRRLPQFSPIKVASPPPEGNPGRARTSG